MFAGGAIRRAAVIVAAAGVLLTTSALRSPTASAFPGALDFGGLQRTYLVHVPAGVEQPAGLVLNLHGGGQNGGQQMALSNYNVAADQHGFLVAYPDGVDMSWADGRGASVPDRTGVDDVGFLVALADQLATQYGIDRSNVFATGMSAGGFMTTRLGCDRADVFSAIAPVAATYTDAVACTPSEPVSVLGTNGNADPVVPFNGGPMIGRGGPSTIVPAPAMAQRWFDVNACPPPVVEPGPGVLIHTATGCADGTEVEFVQVEGGDHTWPMGAFDASQAGAQFFAEH